jgi:hypothetical protein
MRKIEKTLYVLAALFGAVYFFMMLWGLGTTSSTLYVEEVCKAPLGQKTETLLFKGLRFTSEAGESSAGLRYRLRVERVAPWCNGHEVKEETFYKDDATRIIDKIGNDDITICSQASSESGLRSLTPWVSFEKGSCP